MARPGVSREAVEAVIQELTDKGEAPTNTAIRQALGDTGSFSTINRLRQEIMEERRSAPVVSAPDIPESVSEAGRRWMRAVWEEASQQAAAAREVERLAFEEQRTAFESQQTEMLAEIERLEAALEASEGMVQEKRRDAEERRGTLEQVRRDLAAEQAALKEVREHNARLRDERQRLETAMQDERESWMERRGEMERAQLGAEVRAEQMEAALTSAQAAQVRAETEADEQAGMLKELRAEGQGLHARLATAEAKTQALADQVETLQSERQDSAASLAQWIERATTAEAELNMLQGQAVPAKKAARKRKPSEESETLL